MNKVCFFIIILFCSCKGKLNTAPKENKKIEKKVISDSFAKNYNAFFKKFSTDSMFQRKRLKDTIAFCTNENEIDSKLKVVYYTKDDFQFANYIKEDSLAYIRDYDRYKTETIIRIDSAMRYNYGVDNGIYRFYVFKQDGLNNWYLTSIHDYSN